MDPAALKELRRIPGIGPSLAADLYSLGYRRPEDLAQADPEAMYARLEELTGQRQDRCVLYAFRCAVYFVATAHPEPEKLKWWHWKD